MEPKIGEVHDIIERLLCARKGKEDGSGVGLPDEPGPSAIRPARGVGRY
jgi:hypothetical protein